MILWKFKEELETSFLASGNTIDWPCRAFRWVIEASPWVIGLVHQHQFKDTLEWSSSHSYVYEIGVVRKFGLGSSHFWYDGPHCCWKIGWLRVWWGGDCEKGVEVDWIQEMKDWIIFWRRLIGYVGMMNLIPWLLGPNQSFGSRSPWELLIEGRRREIEMELERWEEGEPL